MTSYLLGLLLLLLLFLQCTFFLSFPCGNFALHHTQGISPLFLSYLHERGTESVT